MTSPAVRPTNRERELASLVGSRVTAHQAALESGNPAMVSRARADLAVLRGLKPGHLGQDTASWTLTMNLLPPDSLGRGDLPSRTERAAHAALVLFAVHTQSARAAAHVRDRNLGFAIRQLAEARDSDDPAGGPVMARFQTLGRAQTFEQLAGHLRSLIQLLRGESIALDYGMLAADLYRWQQPDGPAVTRLRWGRGFHRTPRTPDSAPDNATKPTSTESETIDVR